jgi:hypothetical protein
VRFGLARIDVQRVITLFDGFRRPVLNGEGKPERAMRIGVARVDPQRHTKVLDRPGQITLVRQSDAQLEVTQGGRPGSDGVAPQRF